MCVELVRLMDPCVNTLTRYTAYHRLIYAEFLPALSVLLCATQASHQVAVYKLLRLEGGAYQFHFLDTIPQKQQSNMPIFGQLILFILVCALCGLSQADVVCMLCDGVGMSVGQVTADEGESSCVDQHTSSSSPIYYRVYLLYADGQLSCHELSQANVPHLLDISSCAV